MIRSIFGDRVYDSKEELKEAFKNAPIDLSVREMEIANRQFGVTFSCEKGTVYMDMDEVPYDGEGGLSL